MGRSLASPFLEKHEGFRTKVYFDGKKNPTIGAGLNLNDASNRFFLEQRGYKFDDIMAGKEVPAEILRELHEHQLSKKEEMVKSMIDKDFYETLPENKRAALLSLGYNSANLIGPKLKEHMSAGNDIDAMREIVLGSKYDSHSPGLLKRRLEEAQLYGGPEQMQNMFRSFSNEDFDKYNKAKSAIQNEHELQDFENTYGSYLKEDKPSFNKINKMLTVTPPKDSPLK